MMDLIPNPNDLHYQRFILTYNIAILKGQLKILEDQLAVVDRACNQVLLNLPADVWDIVMTYLTHSLTYVLSTCRASCYICCHDQSYTSTDTSR